MIKKIFNLFTGKSNVPSNLDMSSDKEIGDIVAFVDYVVRALVDEPEMVKIEVKPGDRERTKVININCKREDVGKIIGKSGKTIMAIRALVSGAANRLEQQISVEVADNIAN